MKKVLLWVVANDGRFFQGAVQILEQQYNGIEIVGVTASEEIQLFKGGQKIPFIPLDKVDAGGGAIFFLSSVRYKSA